MTALEWVAKARKVMEIDGHLANYMVRDLPETKAAGLDDLAWAMHREPLAAMMWPTCWTG